VKTPYRALVICLLSLLLSSCATLDKDECLNADWYLIGVEDGADGELFSRIGDHREACAKYNIIPNLPGYASGRRAGLKQYCTDSIGFSEGRDGNEYNGVCPKALEADFLAGYDDGVRLYRAEEAKNSLESELRYAQGKLRKTRDALLEKKAELIADATLLKNAPPC